MTGPRLAQMIVGQKWRLLPDQSNEKSESPDYLDVIGTKRSVSETVGDREVWIR